MNMPAHSPVIHHPRGIIPHRMFTIYVLLTECCVLRTLNSRISCITLRSRSPILQVVLHYQYQTSTPTPYHGLVLEPWRVEGFSRSPINYPVYRKANYWVRFRSGQQSGTKALFEQRFEPAASDWLSEKGGRSRGVPELVRMRSYM